MSSDRKPSNTQSAIKQLRGLIFAGALPPGSNHFEEDLAQRLNMSRTPIREASLTLQQQGLLSIQPRRGIHIRGLSVSEMSDIYEVLAELESLAAERVAEAHLPSIELKTLRMATDAMSDAVQRADRTSWAEADDLFHTKLVRLSDNRHLIDLVGRSLDQVRRARGLTLNLRPLPTGSTDDHKAVLAAIEAGDGAAARSLHLAHRRRARDMMVKFLTQLGTRPL